MTLTAGIFLIVLVVALAVFGVYLTRRVQYVLVGQPEARHDRLGTRAWRLRRLRPRPEEALQGAGGRRPLLHLLGLHRHRLRHAPDHRRGPVGGVLAAGASAPGRASTSCSTCSWCSCWSPSSSPWCTATWCGRRGWRPSLEAAIILALIFGLVAASPRLQRPRLRARRERSKYALAPVTGALAALFGPLDDGATETGMQVFWWVHLVLLLAFLVYIPLSKHLHLIMCPVNEFFRNLKPRGAQIGRSTWRTRTSRSTASAASTASRGGSSWTCTPAPSAAAARTTAPRG